ENGNPYDLKWLIIIFDRTLKYQSMNNEDMGVVHCANFIDIGNIIEGYKDQQLILFVSTEDTHTEELQEMLVQHTELIQMVYVYPSADPSIECSKVIVDNPKVNHISFEQDIQRELIRVQMNQFNLQADTFRQAGDTQLGDLFEEKAIELSKQLYH
ncbi:unnamed protein product, partial [Didymodactylos carnosus]